MIVLYIIGGIILLSILFWSGVISEFLAFLSIVLIGGLIGAFFGAIYSSGAGTGFQNGAWFGFVLYVIYSIMRIVFPEKGIRYFRFGSPEKFNTKNEGIIGLIISFLSVVIYFCCK
jgi:hypothetical protein